MASEERGTVPRQARVAGDDKHWCAGAVFGEQARHFTTLRENDDHACRREDARLGQALNDSKWRRPLMSNDKIKAIESHCGYCGRDENTRPEFATVASALTRMNSLTLRQSKYLGCKPTGPDVNCVLGKRRAYSLDWPHRFRGELANVVKRLVEVDTNLSRPRDAGHRRHRLRRVSTIRALTCEQRRRYRIDSWC